MKKTIGLLLVSFMILCSVSFAGVHSPPVDNETKIAKADFINYVITIPVAAVEIAVAPTSPESTPAVENSTAFYAKSPTNPSFISMAVDAATLFYGSGDARINPYTKLILKKPGNDPPENARSYSTG